MDPPRGCVRLMELGVEKRFHVLVGFNETCETRLKLPPP